jgi:signal transduction histidine kinase
MGLGLFLARAVIEGVGGTLQIDSRAGEGTEVLALLPTDVTPREVVATSSREPVTPAVVSKPA